MSTNLVSFHAVLTLSGTLGVWTAAWGLGLKLGPRWDGRASTGLVTFPLHGAMGRVCVIGAVVWLLLVGAVWPQGKPFFPGTGSWHLGVRYRQRVREGRPVEAGLLRAYGMFAAAGFGLGLVLALRLAVDLGWRNPVATQFWQVVNQGFLPLAVLYLAGRLVPEPDGTAAFQGSVSGLILSAGGLYLVKTRPRQWRLWLALVILGAIGFMVFTQFGHEIVFRPRVRLYWWGIHPVVRELQAWCERAGGGKKRDGE